LYRRILIRRKKPPEFIPVQSTAGIQSGENQTPDRNPGKSKSIIAREILLLIKANAKMP